MLSPSQYAEKIGKPYQTVMAWLRKDLIEGAEKTEVGKMSVYLIPEDAKYTEPPMGRPPKPLPSQGGLDDSIKEMLSALGEELQIKFKKFSNHVKHSRGDWTWSDADNGRKLEIQLWEGPDALQSDAVSIQGLADETGDKEEIKGRTRKAIQKLLKTEQVRPAKKQAAKKSTSKAKGSK